MLIKVHKDAAKKTSGLPRAGLVVSNGENAMGAKQITMQVAAYDAYDMPHGIANLYLSPAEAMHIGEALIAAAKKASE
jgi:hypothetical protein